MAPLTKALSPRRSRQPWWSFSNIWDWLHRRRVLLFDEDESLQRRPHRYAGDATATWSVAQLEVENVGHQGALCNGRHVSLNSTLLY